jgi:hypothetical protein
LLALLSGHERRDAWREIANGFRRFETPGGVSIPGEQRVIVGVA